LIHQLPPGTAAAVKAHAARLWARLNTAAQTNDAAKLLPTLPLWQARVLESVGGLSEIVRTKNIGRMRYDFVEQYTAEWQRVRELEFELVNVSPDALTAPPVDIQSKKATACGSAFAIAGTAQAATMARGSKGL
jgi:hypothetical protein